ncbi:hypothetical protein YC2023_116622 [Brassica napus]
MTSLNHFYGAKIPLLHYVAGDVLKKASASLLWISTKPPPNLSDVVVILFIRIIRRSFLGQILGSDQINDAWRRVNMRR